MRMGFMDENCKLVEIPENIQKHIEAREEFWADKFKDIDIKCGIVLERLKLTEKALELACEMICGLAVFDKLGYEKAVAENCEYFKAKAKEMMKSE